MCSYLLRLDLLEKVSHWKIRLIYIEIGMLKILFNLVLLPVISSQMKIESHQEPIWTMFYL